MLFNSYSFIFAFFPATLLIYFLLGRARRSYAIAWLALASFIFYGVWNASFVWLLVGSILFNYAAGLGIIRLGRAGAPMAKAALVAAIAADLALLAYYKYSGFFVQNWAELVGANLPAWNVVLPVGISFYTFTQIAFLVDAYAGKVQRAGFIEYVLFVTYFPHLIAGPILHHAEMISQFVSERTVRFQPANVSIGLAIFVLGLSKKILIADNVEPYANTVFDATLPPSFVEAWIGALAYTVRIYFDFSGYSDMAIGISRMMNIDLPLNFYAPYKATSIIEFWRRWHISLSRFLRDYLYIPLGGNRRGSLRRYLNLITTMLLGGLWHGAAWTFVIWGALHGFFLFVNHAFRTARRRAGWRRWPGEGLVAWALTFACVVVAWVFFASPSLEAALRMLSGMAGLNTLLTRAILREDAIPAMLWTTGGLMIAWFLPNSQQIFRLPFVPQHVQDDSHGREFPADQPNVLTRLLAWRPTTANALAYGLLAVICIMLLTRTTRFLYFQF